MYLFMPDKVCLTQDMSSPGYELSHAVGKRGESGQPDPADGVLSGERESPLVRKCIRTSASRYSACELTPTHRLTGGKTEAPRDTATCPKPL